jgi:hypothetical protein
MAGRSNSNSNEAQFRVFTVFAILLTVVALFALFLVLLRRWQPNAIEGMAASTYEISYFYHPQCRHCDLDGATKAVDEYKKGAMACGWDLRLRAINVTEDEAEASKMKVNSTPTTFYARGGDDPVQLLDGSVKGIRAHLQQMVDSCDKV